MENEEFLESLRQFVLPVILDHNATSHRLATSFYRRYGILSTLCGPRQNVRDLLDPRTSFLSLDCISNPPLAAEQLMDFAHTYDELILLLIPMNEAQKQFLSAYEDRLESRYILTDPETVFSYMPSLSF